MNQRRRQIIGRAALLGIGLLFALASGPLLAEDTPWTVRGFGVAIDGGFTAYGDDQTQFESEFGGGLEASLEYRASPRLGIELSHLVGAVGTTIDEYDRHWDSNTDGLGFSSLLLGLNVHLTPNERVRVYVSPIVGHVWFSEVDYDWYHSRDRRLRVGNAYAWGGGAGIDIRIAESRWSVSLEAKYLDTNIDRARRGSHSRFDASFDPFIIGVGFGFDF